MAFDVERVHLGIANLHTSRVLAWLEHRTDRKSTEGGRAADERQDRVPRTKRHAGPVATDLTEEAVLDRVPFAAAGWIVAHGHPQAELIAELDLQAFLPGSRLAAIAAASVGQQQKVVRSWEAQFSFGLPPR